MQEALAQRSPGSGVSRDRMSRTVRSVAPNRPASFGSTYASMCIPKAIL